MVLSLLHYYANTVYWRRADVLAIEAMQLRSFQKLYAWAAKQSKFYREYYGDHGALGLSLRSLEEIRRIPPVSKAILRAVPLADIVTRNNLSGLNIHSTSGSTGEPLRVAYSRFEDYTAHVRVFWALRRAGYSPSQPIVMITRYNPGESFQIEKDIAAIKLVQKILRSFRSEIISIYDPVDTIIDKLQITKARLLWSTPSILQIIAQRLKERGIALRFPCVFLTSEMVSEVQKQLFLSWVGKEIVGLYGAIESPSLGFDFGLQGRFEVFPNSNLFEFAPQVAREVEEKVGRVIITNLINRTTPIIRYELNDLAELGDDPGFGRKHIGRIIGRQDDILELGQGRFLAHHHAHEMFMDFHECDMFRFVQTKDQAIRLKLKIPKGSDPAQVEKLARCRWEKRFAGVPLAVEFVEYFEVDPCTGKFKNMEIE